MGGQVSKLREEMAAVPASVSEILTELKTLNKAHMKEFGSDAFIPEWANEMKQDVKKSIIDSARFAHEHQKKWWLGDPGDCLPRSDSSPGSPSPKTPDAENAFIKKKGRSSNSTGTLSIVSEKPAS